MSGNLYTILQQHFPRDLSAIFLETEERCFSYRDFEQETARYGRYFQALGLSPGDRILTQLDKTPQSFLLTLAAVRAGLVCLPLNPAYRKNEVQYILSDAEPKLVVCRPGAVADYSKLFDELRDQFAPP